MRLNEILIQARVKKVTWTIICIPEVEKIAKCLLVDCIDYRKSKLSQGSFFCLCKNYIAIWLWRFFYIFFSNSISDEENEFYIKGAHFITYLHIGKWVLQRQVYPWVGGKGTSAPPRGRIVDKAWYVCRCRNTGRVANTPSTCTLPAEKRKGFIIRPLRYSTQTHILRLGSLCYVSGYLLISTTCSYFYEGIHLFIHLSYFISLSIWISGYLAYVCPCDYRSIIFFLAKSQSGIWNRLSGRRLDC